MNNIGILLKERRKSLGLTQSDVSRRTGVAREVISKIENGKENITISTLNLIAQKGLCASLNIALNSEVPAFSKEKRSVIEMVKSNGGLWSYDIARSDLTMDDDFVIENGLRYLDLEQMHILFDIYGRERVYNVWVDRFLSQGRRLGTFNLVLAAMVFKIKNSLDFVNSYGKSK